MVYCPFTHNQVLPDLFEHGPHLRPARLAIAANSATPNGSRAAQSSPRTVSATAPSRPACVTAFR